MMRNFVDTKTMAASERSALKCISSKYGLFPFCGRVNRFSHPILICSYTSHDLKERLSRYNCHSFTSSLPAIEHLVSCTRRNSLLKAHIFAVQNKLKRNGQNKSWTRLNTTTNIKIPKGQNFSSHSSFPPSVTSRMTHSALPLFAHYSVHTEFFSEFYDRISRISGTIFGIYTFRDEDIPLQK